MPRAVIGQERDQVGDLFGDRDTTLRDVGEIYGAHLIDRPVTLRVQHVGVDGTRADGVDPDSLSGVVQCHSPGEVGDRPLGGAVGGQPSCTDQAVGGADVHDGPTTG